MCIISLLRLNKEVQIGILLWINGPPCMLDLRTFYRSDRANSLPGSYRRQSSDSTSISLPRAARISERADENQPIHEPSLDEDMSLDLTQVSKASQQALYRRYFYSNMFKKNLGFAAVVGRCGGNVFVTSIWRKTSFCKVHYIHINTPKPTHRLMLAAG